MSLRAALVAVALALVSVAWPTAGALDRDLQRPDTLVVMHIDNEGTMLAWTPAVGAVGYIVFRGAEPDKMVEVARTRGTTFYDAVDADGVLFYSIAALDSMGGTAQSPTVGMESRGSCLATSSSLHVSVNAYNCISWVP